MKGERGYALGALAVLLGLLPCFPAAAAPTLTDFWDGLAEWQADSTGIGANIGFHFPSVIWEGSQMWAYYIKNYDPGDGSTKTATSRAVSTDGLNWTNSPSADNGIVVDISGRWEWIFQSESLSHQIGRADGDGWSANTSRDGSGYLCYGPYTTSIPAGACCASFKMMIDVHSGVNDKVVTVDINDATAGTELATKDIYRRDFSSDMTYQVFELNFTSTAAHQLEFRTYWRDKAYIKQDCVGAARGSSPFWDGRMASFPGVWKDGGTYYLVYEGSGASRGEIGLARSTDGVHFTKSSPNPICQHNSSGIEQANIGTPSLYKENGVWYLFYHSFDWTDCRDCVATGTDLTSLTKYSGNPIIDTVSNTWESGTIGRRSTIFKEGSYYYLTYEGSTEQPYDTARWSTGLARSTDLLHWTKYPSNPVIPQTASGMGNDGPELVKISNVIYLYCRVAPTSRWKLVWKPGLEPKPPSNPGATNMATNSIRWTWQDNSDDESGFKVWADPGTSAPTTLRTTTGPNVACWDYTGLTPNARYSFQVAATSDRGDSAKTSVYPISTLARSPTVGQNVTCNRSVGLWYPAGTTFTFTNPAGFGSSVHGGAQYIVKYFRYAWDTNLSHTWTGAESQWSSGALTLSPASGDGCYYLHLESFNFDNAPNPAALDYGPFNHDGTAPVTSAGTPGGVYCGARSIVLNAGEPAAIYYTTDGTEPTAGPPAYSGPIAISSSTTLRFFAIDAAGNQESPKKSEVYAILTQDGLISAVRRMAEGAAVELGDKVLYLKRAGFGYIAEPERFAGLRIEGTVSANEGEIVCLAGILHQPPGGEPYVTVTGMSSNGPFDLKPLAATNRAIRQTLVDGIFVKAWGEVKAGSIVGNSYVITDGSDQEGIRVVTPGAPGVIEGQFVAVVGAAGYDGSRIICSRQ